MTNETRINILIEHIVFEKTWTEIANDLGISKQRISNDRRRHADIWETETAYVKAFENSVLIPQRKAFCEESIQRSLALLAELREDPPETHIPEDILALTESILCKFLCSTVERRDNLTSSQLR